MTNDIKNSRIRINIHQETGDLILSIGDESESLTNTEIDELCSLLNIGKLETKEFKNSLEKMKIILKSYQDGKRLKEIEVKIKERLLSNEVNNI